MKGLKEGEGKKKKGGGFTSGLCLEGREKGDDG